MTGYGLDDQSFSILGRDKNISLRRRHQTVIWAYWTSYLMDTEGFPSRKSNNWNIKLDLETSLRMYESLLSTIHPH
jgi:hypothetical protein